MTEPLENASTANGNSGLKLTAKALEWFKDRGIGEKTLKEMGVGSGMAVFGDIKTEAAIFNYYRDGLVVNYKARAFDEKLYKQKKGGEQCFYGLEAVLRGSRDVVYITEGEMDALSLIECGVPKNQVLSVPNGAPPERVADKENSAKYQYVYSALDEGLNDVKKFILAVDSDEKGDNLREDLAEILGTVKCSYINWPDKDANEHLMQYGPERLLDFVLNKSIPCPVIGLYSLSEIPEPEPMELWNPGFYEWENKVKFSPKMFSVATGWPGHGKTMLMMQLWYQMAKSYDFSFAVFSAETRVKPHHRRNFRRWMFGKYEDELTEQQIKTADDWTEENVKFISHPNARPTFGWLLDMIEAAHARFNCRAVVIDPWNKLDTQKPRDKTETDWIGECIDDLMDAARGLNMHIQVIAHPSKGEKQFRKDAPALSDIHGSQHWENRPDQGFAVHRPSVFKDGERQTEAEFYHRKARFEELGYPCMLNMDFELKTGRYRSVDFKQDYEE